MATVNDAGQRLRAFEEIDFSTREGAAIRAMLVERLEYLRPQLENENLSERETMFMRGRIAEVKKMLQAAPPVVKLARYDNMTQTHPRGE